MNKLLLRGTADDTCMTRNANDPRVEIYPAIICIVMVTDDEVPLAAFSSRA
jgi:hypothetical protein